jgi:hypothetical protein
MVCATSRGFNYELRIAAVSFVDVLVLTICAARDRVVFSHLGSSQMVICCKDFQICILLTS